MPDALRPYKAWGYPYATLLFVAVTGWFLVNTFLRDTRNAVIGLVLLLGSLPFYYHWAGKPGNSPDRRAAGPPAQAGGSRISEGVVRLKQR